MSGRYGLLLREDEPGFEFLAYPKGGVAQGYLRFVPPRGSVVARGRSGCRRIGRCRESKGYAYHIRGQRFGGVRRAPQ